jgi:hypothetical protein
MNAAAILGFVMYKLMRIAEDVWTGMVVFVGLLLTSASIVVLLKIVHMILLG